MKRNIIISSLLLISIFCFFGFNANNFEYQNRGGQSTDKGIGPVKEVKLGKIDQRLVDKGNDIYNNKCSACHNIDDVNLAPTLRGITKGLSPVFIMNYLMNTTEMQKKDPYVKKLIQDWKKVPMIKDQHLKENEARAVLEFLRSLEK